MAEQKIDMMVFMGMKPPADGGSDDDVVRGATIPDAKYYLSNGKYGRSISYRDPRTGSEKYIEPGDPRFKDARDKLEPAMKSELALRQGSYLEGLAEESRMQNPYYKALAEGGDESLVVPLDPLPQTDPETYEPYAESYTDLGLEEQRAYERGDVGSQQEYFTKERERLSTEVESARTELDASVAAQKRYEAGELDAETLRDRLLLGQRQKALRRKERESQQATTRVLPEKYLDRPSKAKQTIGDLLSGLTEERIPELEEEVSILERTLVEVKEQAKPGPSPQRPFMRASVVSAEARNKLDNVTEQLQKKKDELFYAQMDENKYRQQIGLLGETLPIREGEERSRLVNPIIERDMFGTGRSRREDGGVSNESSSPSVDPFNNGLPIQPNWWETQEPLSPSDLPRYHGGLTQEPLSSSDLPQWLGGTAPDPELDALKGQYGELNVDYADLPRDYSLPTASDLNQAGDLSPGQTKDDELLKNSLTPSTTVLDTSKQDAAASTTDTGRPSIRTRF